jgi:hypothetical protein
MSTTNILKKIQDMLITKYGDDLKLIDKEVSEGMFGPTFSNSILSYSSSDEDDIDVDNAGAADTPYTTHVRIPEPKGKKAGSNSLPFGEAEEIDTEEEATGVADKAMATADKVETGTNPGAAASGADPGGDMNLGGIGGIGGMDNTGMFGQEEEKTPSQLGRIYELKKIYSRLTSIESYLANESDSQLMEVRNYVSQGIELFEIISANFNSYQDKLDEIIITYYKFILEIYETVKRRFSVLQKSGD